MDDPPELTDLLNSPDDEKWQRFLERRSGDIEHTCRWVIKGNEELARDAYVFVLDGLRAKGYARLRKYHVQPNCTFATWLRAVTQRLVYDFLRTKYPRPRPNESEKAKADRKIKKTLADLIAIALESAGPLSDAAEAADERLMRIETHEALDACLRELTKDQRLLLTFRMVDGLTLREITTMMAFSSLFHVHRAERGALATLKACLASRGIFGA